MPRWDGEFWASDSKAQAVTIKRPTGSDSIKASDPAFDDGVWMTYQSAGCLYEQLINNCEKWKNTNLGCTPLPKTQTPQTAKVYQELKK